MADPHWCPGGGAVNADLLTLARAVVALPGWEWRPGMLTADGERMLVDVACGLMRYIAAPYDEESDRDMMDGAVPDLADGATGGVMLAMLCAGGWIASARPCYGDEAGVVSGWFVEEWTRRPVGSALVPLQPYYGRTLAEAVARCALARGRWA